MPFKSGNNSADTTYNGVDCYGGTQGNDQTSKIPNKFDDDVASTGALPSGVNKYGATEDLGEQGEAALKHGTNRIPGMS